MNIFETVCATVGLATMGLIVAYWAVRLWRIVHPLPGKAWRGFRKWRRRLAEERRIRAQEGKCPHGFPIHNKLRDCKTCREEDAAELNDDSERLKLAKSMGVSWGDQADAFAYALLAEKQKLEDRRWYWGNIPRSVKDLGPQAVEAYKKGYKDCIEKPPAGNTDWDGDEVTASHCQPNRVFGGYSARMLVNGMVRIEDVPILGICADPHRRVTADTLWWLMDRARGKDYRPPITIGSGLGQQQVGYVEVNCYRSKPWGPRLHADLVVNEEIFRRIQEGRYPYYTVCIQETTSQNPRLVELLLLETGPTAFKNFPLLKIRTNERRG